ncbi:helix-turn-helix domain-containing protein [Rhodococcus sp. BH5]|uniref:helix-turn-helix domain-containing protein n=1 Tax=Rhodococcus sp. BH5 TaxID=2871702 RepID=UPI003FA743C2
MVQVAEFTASTVRSSYKRSGYSIASLADETGIPFTTLQRRCSGKTPFRVHELVLVSSALGVPVRDLVSIPSSEAA